MKATTKERPGFMMYHDLLPQVEMMSPDEAGELLRALLFYSRTGIYDKVPLTVELILLGYIPRIYRGLKGHGGFGQPGDTGGAVRRSVCRTRRPNEGGLCPFQGGSLPADADASFCMVNTTVTQRTPTYPNVPQKQP